MIRSIVKGDFLSETSHYKVINVGTIDTTLEHTESNTTVVVSNNYIRDFLFSAQEVTREVMVTKSDRMDGTLGIRSIFNNISGSEVFSVCFRKQDKPKSKKSVETEIKTRVSQFEEAIQKAVKQKKGVAKIVRDLLEDSINNPILNYEPGEIRILQGYKIKHDTINGQYMCLDMALNEERSVNINTIKWLIYKGVKYTVKE